MALKLGEKEAIVSEVAAIANCAVLLVVAEYAGLSVNQFTALRKAAREVKVYLRVIRNTLAHRIVEGTPYACIQAILSGPLVLAFSLETPRAAPQVIENFMKENAQLKVKAIAMENQIFSPDCLSEFSALPTHKEALSRLISVILIPAAYLAFALSEIYSAFVRVMGAVMTVKKQADLTSNVEVEFKEMNATAINEKVKNIVQEISALSVLELKSLVKEVEDVFGVSSAPMMMGGASAQTGVAALASPVEEKTEFSVFLNKVSDSNKLKVTKAVREETSLTLLEAKKLVESAPVMVKEALSKVDAEKLKKKLEEAGAEVEMK